MWPKSNMSHLAIIKEKFSINGLWPCLTSVLKNHLCCKAHFPLITLLTPWPPPHHNQLHTPTFHFTSSPHHNLLIFFFPHSSINFLLLSPYKSPPLLFVGACLIAISVTPYYISNDWLWALIRDVLGRADLLPTPPPPSCFSAELLLWLHRRGDTISTAPLRVATPDC